MGGRWRRSQHCVRRSAACGNHNYNRFSITPSSEWPHYSLARRMRTMRSFEQREFVPLFQREDEREAQSIRAESAAEMSQLVLRLVRSIESLTRAVLRAN